MLTRHLSRPDKENQLNTTLGGISTQQFTVIICIPFFSASFHSLLYFSHISSSSKVGARTFQKGPDCPLATKSNVKRLVHLVASFNWDSTNAHDLWINSDTDRQRYAWCEIARKRLLVWCGCLCKEGGSNFAADTQNVPPRNLCTGRHKETVSTRNRLRWGYKPPTIHSRGWWVEGRRSFLCSSQREWWGGG